jgi:rod shape-determining protein MreC
VPRNRTARSAVLGVSVRRAAVGHLPSRTTSALRRRLVVGVLVLLALLLVTFSFRSEDEGPLASAQNAGASVLRPFQVAADRVAEPFRDMYSWVDGLFDARSRAERAEAEAKRLRQENARLKVSAAEAEALRGIVGYVDGPRFPDDYDGVTAAVISRPPGAYAQAVVIAAGTKDGVNVQDTVVNEDGLVGVVTRVSAHTARVTLLTDEQSAASAMDVRTKAAGIVRHGRGARATLILDRVPKEDVVKVGDTIVTSGWSSGRLASLFPKGIQIGRVTSVGQADTDLWKQVQVEPFVDFGALEALVVLVPAERAAVSR